MTIRKFKIKHGVEVSEAAIRRRLERRGFGVFGVNDVLSSAALNFLLDRYEVSPQKKTVDQAKPKEVKRPVLPKIITDPPADPVRPEAKKPETIKPQPEPARQYVQNNFQIRTGVDWAAVRQWLPAASLPMLALSAAYGVYYFAAQFVPPFIAIIEAASFELIYIGLAMIETNDEQKKHARAVSIGAVGVSIIYNTIAAALHQEPGLLDNLTVAWRWTVAIIHGAPLAILAYLVSDLLFHRDN